MLLRCIIKWALEGAGSGLRGELLLLWLVNFQFLNLALMLHMRGWLNSFSEEQVLYKHIRWIHVSQWIAVKFTFQKS